MIKLLFISLALASASAFSSVDRLLGDWGSGGGNALVCFGDTNVGAGEEPNVQELLDEIKASNNTIPDRLLKYISSIEMFDLYEAKKRRGIDSPSPQIIEIREDEKIYEYIDRLAKRFEKTVPFMQGLAREGKEMIPDSRLVFNEYAVKYQNDLGSVTLPGPNCVIATMAAQVNYNDFYEVNIDSRLFNHPKHSKQSQATLILHELLYAVGRKHFDQTDSGGTRNIVRQFISFHPLITEDSVSKGLYDLGYFKASEWLPAFEYMHSEIFQSLMETLSLHNDEIKDNLEHYLVMSGMTQELLDAFAQDNYQVENPRFEVLENVIQDRVINSDRREFWKLLQRRFYQSVEMWQGELEGYTDGLVAELLDNLREDTLITDQDLLTVGGFVKHHYGSYGEGWFGPEELSGLFESYTERKNVAVLLSEWTRSEVCTSTVSTGPITIEVPMHGQTKGDEVCFGPLRLSNVIPRD